VQKSANVIGVILKMYLEKCSRSFVKYKNAHVSNKDHL